MNKYKCSTWVTLGVLLTALSFGCNASAQKAAQVKHPYASDKPLDEPVIFGEGVVSAGDFDSHLAFTPDGKTLYFVRSAPTSISGIAICPQISKSMYYNT